MKKLVVTTIALLFLAGCENRAIWNDEGKAREATSDREVWDSKGKMDTGDRKIWNDREGKPVIQ